MMYADNTVRYGFRVGRKGMKRLILDNICVRKYSGVYDIISHPRWGIVEYVVAAQYCLYDTEWPWIAELHLAEGEVLHLGPVYLNNSG